MESEEFKRLFIPLADKLYRIVRRLVDNDEEAKDIIQDAYLKLWEIRDQLREIENREAFCVRLVKNQALDYLKSARYKNACDSISGDMAQEIPQTEKNADPLSEMIRTENGAIVSKLIEHLPQQQKELIRLRHYGECSMEEIVGLTGISAGNVRTILSRARKKIKEEFEKIFEYEHR